MPFVNAMHVVYTMLYVCYTPFDISAKPAFAPIRSIIWPLT